MCASKLQFVCISAPTTRPKVCPRSWLPLSSKTLNIIHTLKWRLLPMRIDKVSTVHEQPKSKDLETRGWLTRPTNRSVVARQRYKSLDGAWMEDILWSATKIREFPRNAVREKKMLAADKRKYWSIVAIRPPRKRSIQVLLMFSSAFHPPWTLLPSSLCKRFKFCRTGYL